MGGYANSQFSRYKKNVFRLNLREKKFTTAPMLNKGRSEHASCVLGDQLYCFGGHDGVEHLGSIERINIASNELNWTLFQVRGFTMRAYPLVSPLNDE